MTPAEKLRAKIDRITRGPVDLELLSMRLVFAGFIMFAITALGTGMYYSWSLPIPVRVPIYLCGSCFEVGLLLQLYRVVRDV